MTHNEAVGCTMWVVIILICILIALLVSTGCCASTCESMLAECERGLAELHQVQDFQNDDGGCP